MLSLKQRSRILLPILAVLLGTQSCFNRMEDNFNFDKLETASLNPNVAIPLLHGKLTIADLLPKQESASVIADEDNLIHIVYSDTLESRSIRDYFLPKPVIEERDYLVPTLATNPDGKVVESEIPLLLDFPEADFDEITLTAGKIELTVNSTVAADIDVQLHFPTLTKDGQTLTKNLYFPVGNATTQTEVIDLNGYVVDLTSYGLGNNIIPVQIVANASNQQTGAGSIYALGKLTGLEYSLLTGYFGQLAVDLPSDSIQLDIFDKIFSKANFGLKNPSLSFDFLNSNGAPVLAQIHQFEARNAAKETLPILTDPANSMTIEAPLNHGEETVKKLIILNEEEVIKFAPTAILFKFSGSLNPDGRPTTPNFLTDKSRAAVVLNADLPLWGYLEGFTLTDTVQMGIGLAENENYVKEGLIKILIKNQLPLNGELKVDFVDSTNVVIETLFDTDTYENLLPGSTVDANGDVLEGGEGKFVKEIPLTSAKFEKILSAEKIIIRANFATSTLSDGTFPYVKIKADQALSINMGIKASANNLKIKL